ncbi:putative ATP-dependent RNA helicase DDX46 [Nymphon striatum]|nr:putative ATP-dependent RNA helicase DDX46 [Nymphon striatum]
MGQNRPKEKSIEYEKAKDVSSNCLVFVHRYRRSHSKSNSPKNKQARSSERKIKDKSKRSKSPETIHIPEKPKENVNATEPVKEENTNENYQSIDKEAEQSRLELEMQKRRERIEKWRAERKQKEMEQSGGIIDISQIVILPPSKKWTLEDDDDEDLPVENLPVENIDEEIKNGNESNQDEIDPLDAFMIVIGSWTEFNIRTRDNVTVKPDKVGYLPTINAPATELSTVQELLSQSVFIQQHLSLDKIAVIMDQALYAKAAEVAWKHKLRFESLLLMMGNFHIICNMLSIIGKLFRDAGLRDLAVESGVIAEGSIDKVLDGKQYNRGVRLHKLTYEALMRLANPFAKIAIDQTVEETVNMDTQTAGGTKGFSLKQSALTRYYLTAEHRAEALRQLRDLISSGQSQEGLNHADLQSPRVKRDENDVNMSTGAAATSAITSDLLKARSKGEEAFKIHKERLESGSGFFDPIKKQNLQTFTVLQKNIVVNAGTNREMILKADNRVFGNILLIAKSRKLDMKDVLQYPLGPKPWALANADGTLKKTVKATLGNHLEKEVANVDVPSGSCATNSDALKQQTNRANYQAAIWRRSLQNSPEIPSPTNGHGWNVVEGKLGLTGAPAPDVVLELMSCKSPRRCNENCPCVEVDEEVDAIRNKNVKAVIGKIGNKSDKDSSKKKVTVLSGVAKKQPASKRLGELMEQNQDALEYSSEEEEEDLQSTMSGLTKQKKQLTTISMSDLDYQTFRKNFYVEVPELAKLTDEGVEVIRKDNEGIKVKGKGCPKPIKSWPQCGVSKKMLDVLRKYQYEKPTPIQMQAIPAIMSGRDLIGIAKTGSGKTLAFLLPMLRHIMDQPPLESDDGPITIILTPTRELAMQISKECRKFCKVLNLHAVCVYGGTSISEQIAELKRGAEIIVCTPGRMIDMLAANNGRVTNLKRITYVVLDEADRMFDMGFEPQVMRIFDHIRPDRQTVMFSATFPRPMEALARRILTKPIEVLVGGRSVVCKDVEQHVVTLEEDQKFLKLLELLGYYTKEGSVIVFVDKQENADALLKDLLKASYSCMSLHGGIDQHDRDSTIVDFKAGKISILVATSVAARGLDVKHLVLVVNYDCPNHYEDYVHRCGRTGRAGNKGAAYTFVTSSQEKYTVDLIKALELSGSAVPQNLQQICDEYKRQLEAQGKKVKGGSGFSGKGFKFDEAEAQAVNEKKKFQKAVLGLQDSDDEDAEADIDQQIETMLAPKKIVKEVTVAVGLPNPGIPGVSTLPPHAQNAEKLELAKRLASRINVAKNLGPDAKVATQQAAEAILKGEAANPVISAKTIAEQLAEKLNAKLNYQPKADDDRTDEEGVETFKKYEEELEINDFPQQARWKVTSKEALAQISEYSGAGITVRGTYYPTNKDAKDGDRKLYLAIESTNELAVSKAKVEITRLIKEELIRMQTSSSQPLNKGRYKVL